MLSRIDLEPHHLCPVVMHDPNRLQVLHLPSRVVHVLCQVLMVRVGYSMHHFAQTVLQALLTETEHLKNQSMKPIPRSRLFGQLFWRVTSDMAS